MSGDGRFVATSDRYGGHRQVFVIDRVSNAKHFVSLSPEGHLGDDWSDDPSISHDGRFVAFTSRADNLVPGVPENSTQVYVRDMLTGETICASVGDDPRTFAQSAENPSISGDGSRVAFGAKGALTPDAIAPVNVYVRDLHLGQTILACRSSGGSSGSLSSVTPALSGDGQWIAFVSSAPNLIPDDTNGQADAFVRGPLIFARGALGDATQALRIAAGLAQATEDDLATLGPLADGASVTLVDAVRIVRQRQGW